MQPVFQPIFDLESGEMIGMEALSRGPRGSEFEAGETLFQLADRTELLGPLERVCREIALEAAENGPPGRKLFLNISPAAASKLRSRFPAMAVNEQFCPQTAACRRMCGEALPRREP